jgi:hypothetical protein
MATRLPQTSPEERTAAISALLHPVQVFDVDVVIASTMISTM